MKRIISILLLTVLIACSAYADREWTCICGRVNTGNFCGKCGTSREDAQKALRQEPVAASTLKVGDHVTYGRYPQTAEGNDETPIEWLVLDVQGDKALLLSRYGLDTMPYNTEYEDVTWETCSLREWLNGDFLNRAFSAEEQKAIPVTDVDNGKGQGNSEWDTSGGNDTQDRVFLLSFAEACRYLGASLDHDSMKPRVAPTAYLLEKGVWIEDETKTDDGATAGWWWLRSPGSWQDNAVGVAPGGSFYDIYVIGDHIIRPALWIDTGAIPRDQPGNVKAVEASAGRGKAEAGTYVTFGKYPQTAEGTDDTPIEWLVLERDGDTATLISRYGLECVPYSRYFSYSLSWENSEIRDFLNREFYQRAFSDREADAILTVRSANRDYSAYEGQTGGDTDDRVYILSPEELEKYFGMQDTIYENEYGISPAAVCDCTENAYANGADRRPTKEGGQACLWWLRTPCETGRAPFVDSDGTVEKVMGGDTKHIAVRPVIRIRIGQ